MAKRRTPVEELYYKYFANVSVNIMKLGEVSGKIRTILAEGGDVDGKMKALVEEYRQQ